MDSAAQNIADFLNGRYHLAPGQVFLQGSYPNGTAVEPVDGGGYDIDLVAVCARRGQTSDEALNELERHFLSDGRFARRVKHKKPCVRLEYAPDDVGRFHVDVVPARYSSTGQAPLEVPRRGEAWHDSAPAQFTQWCRDQGDGYARTVKSLKRWRDEQQSVRNAIKSIVLQVLVAQHLSRDNDDAARLTHTIESLTAALEPLSSPPVVCNPVLYREDLAARWTPTSFRDFVRELQEARTWIRQANAASDEVEAVEAWREVLGDDFPATPASERGLLLGNTDHERRLDYRDWRVHYLPEYSVSISATQERGKRGQSRRKYSPHGPPILAGHKVGFVADVQAPASVQVWWQVSNTGDHAAGAASLRGDFSKAKAKNEQPSKNPCEHWESTLYTGTHRVRAVLVRQNMVVAVSAWLQVNIYNPQRRPSATGWWR